MMDQILTHNHVWSGKGCLHWMPGLETTDEIEFCNHNRVPRMLKLDVTIKEVDANLDNHHEEYLECKSTFQRYQPMHLSLSRNWILN